MAKRKQDPAIRQSPTSTNPVPDISQEPKHYPEIDSPYSSADDWLPKDLCDAYHAAFFLFVRNSTIIRYVCEPTDGRLEAVVKSALELRGRIKECGSQIAVVSHEITSVNSEFVKVASPNQPLNAHLYVLDIAGIVCEVVWDDSYKDIRSYTARELYSFPLTVELVKNGLPCIAEDLRRHNQDWDELAKQLDIEIARTAHARSCRIAPASLPTHSAEPQATDKLKEAMAETVEEQMDPAIRAIALMLKADKEGHKITVKELERLVGCDRSTLYRDPQFKATRAALKAKYSRNVLKGSRDESGNIDAAYNPDEE